MFHSVVIASLNRPAVLAETLTQFELQTVRPDQIILSVNKPDDLPPHIGSAVVVKGPLGSAVQRNSGLAALDPACEIVSFFDDDVELAPDYCQNLRRAFEQNPDLLACNGRVIADGMGEGGIPREEARRLIATDTAARQQTPVPDVVPVGPSTELHGCNMNVRRSILQTVRFDEKFAAYGWLEDWDFANRLGKIGRLGDVPDCRLVHLATTSGRTSGLRMGISQMINPLYIWKKGSFPSLWHLIRTGLVPALGANVLGTLFGRRARHVDRRGRLKGNLIGLGYVLRGRIDPEVVLRHR